MSDLKVEALYPNGKIDTGMLVEIGSDPELEHFLTACIWKDGTVTTGWSSGIKHTDLAFGLKLLDIAVIKILDGK